MIFEGLLVVLLSSCAASKKIGYRPTDKLPSQALQQDTRLLKSILETNHPSLYWYTPKDSIDLYFNQALLSITDSLTELQYRNKMSWVINKIRCGHTQVRFSKKYTKFYTGRRLPQFPLSLKAWQDSIVVVNNFLKDSLLKRGTIITSINGRTNREVLDSMYSLLGGDGPYNNFQQQLVSFYFPQFYKSTFGIDSTFKIGFLDSTGLPQSTTIPYFKPVSDSLEKTRIAALPKLSRKERKKYTLLSQRNLEIDTAKSTAVFNINTFSEGKLNRFFRKSFKTIDRLQIKNLVIDLRQNSGGSIYSSIRLLQYLVPGSFKLADTIAATSRNFEYRPFIKPWFLYWLSMRFTGRLQPDERVHFRYFEKHNFPPKGKHHFDGNIYVLTGGYTFSAASMVANQLKGQSNVTIVGEETGGGAYGNSAVHLPVITLPNSGLRIVLPLYRMVFKKDQPKDGRGVIPDVVVEPSSQAIRQGIDVKMESVMELIRQNDPKLTAIP